MANTNWVDSFLLGLPGAVKDYKAEWGATRYLVGGKMFVMWGGDKEERPIITVKLEPAFGELMRKHYPGQVVPGYYMNKVHWNSVYESANVPDDQLKEMLVQSHALILASLPKKIQAEISAGPR